MKKKFNLNLSEKEKINLKKELGLKKDDFIIIYTARLDRNKNQGFLIRVMDELIQYNSNIHLLLVGTDELNGKYQNYSKKLGLNNNIHFLGFRSDVNDLLKISDVAVSASLREGLPVNILEAMASGLPIVATEARGVRDLIEHHTNGYVISKNNLSEFVKKIKRLYDKKDIETKYSEENINRIKKYNLESITEKLSKIYFRKKKILHVLASNKYSGAENVACTIIKNMSKDYDMAYCCPKGDIEKVLQDNKIIYYGINKLSFKNIKKVIKIYSPDVIHAHDNKATVIASLFSKKCKIISHIHGNNKIMNKLNLKTFLFNYCSKKVDRIIWVSDSSLNDYYFKKNVINKSIVLYNVIDQNEIIKKSNLYDCDKDFDLIFLGRLGYPKNIKRFINIVKFVKEKKKDISVAVVGDGPDRNIVEKLIDKYNLDDNITMYGFQENPYPILKKSKILVMTSIYEGTPMCALEAQALGKPIIATPVDGLKKIIKNGYNGYLSDSDEEIVELIIKIIFNCDFFDVVSKNVLNSFNKMNKFSAYLDEISKNY